jgi:hypothetical protein
VSRLGVDLLRGTIEELSRRGHRHITGTIEHPDDVDTCARAVLAEVAARLAGCERRLTIQWSADEDGGSADVRLADPGCTSAARATVGRRATAVSRRADGSVRQVQPEDTTGPPPRSRPPRLAVRNALHDL